MGRPRVEGVPFLFVEVLRRCNSRVVLSTNWKNDPDKSRDLMDAFEDYGISVCDVTPTLPVLSPPGMSQEDLASMHRAQEIAAWFNQGQVLAESCGAVDDLQVEKFIGNWAPALKGRIVKTNPFVGFDQQAALSTMVLFRVAGPGNVSGVTRQDSSLARPTTSPLLPAGSA